MSRGEPLPHFPAHVNVALCSVPVIVPSTSCLLTLKHCPRVECSCVTRQQTRVAFPLYETPNTNARYTAEPDMRLLGEVMLSLPSGWASKVSGTDYDLEVRNCSCPQLYLPRRLLPCHVPWRSPRFCVLWAEGQMPIV